MTAKRLFTLIALGVLLGSGLGAMYYNGLDTKGLKADVTNSENECFRMNDTHMVQCAQEEPACAHLDLLPNTSYIYRLPKTVMNDDQCLASYSGDEIFWTKYVNGTTVTTDSVTLVQSPSLENVIFPVEDCALYNPGYICIDETEKSNLSAYWRNDDEKHFVLERPTGFYEYVYDMNREEFLYSTVQDQYFTTGSSTTTLGFKIQVPEEFADNNAEITVKFGEILDTGLIRDKTIAIIGDQNKTSFDASFRSTISVKSRQFSEANMWKIEFALDNQLFESSWIPARIQSYSEIVEFDENFHVINADSENWVKDFYGTHSAQLYNVVSQEIENTRYDIGGAFIKNSDVFVFTTEDGGQQRLYSVLSNSGVLPDVPECSSGEKIHVSNDSDTRRTDNFLTGDKGSFVLIGDSIDEGTVVSWTISNPEVSRLKNASQYEEFSSTSVAFEILPRMVASTELATSSVLTAVTQGEEGESCTIALTLHFSEGLKVGVDAVDVMTK